MEIEEQLITAGHEIMNPKKDEKLADYKKRLQEYLEKAADIKRSDLGGCPRIQS
jgi:uncharacterized protein YaaR (DUF327 family)